jgi:hypothetical protein
MDDIIKFDSIIRDEYLERARNKQTSRDIKPSWVGQFWNDENMPQDVSALPIGEPASRESCLIQLVRNVPYREVIERAASLRPDAREILEKWRLVWERSFPGFENHPDWNHDNVGQSYVGWTVSRLKHVFSKAETGINVRPKPRQALQTAVLAEKAKFFAEADRISENAKDDPRDSRLHIIDDVDTVLSCSDMIPGGVVLIHSNKALRYIGNHDDGLPLFEDIGMRADWMQKRLDDHPEYWFWSPFMKYMKRRSIYADNRETAAAILADMAWQGETHAFVKGASSKSGTWTVDLFDVKTFEEAESKLTMLKSNDATIIQERLPFTHEQRFYIYNGKLMTSACSDRNLSRIDCREGKRLDDRLAVIKVPSINSGAYDRGITSHVIDRDMSAKFAREVRKIAAELKAHGIMNYVVDMGLTERGVTAVEINTLHYAGPYCMDHTWQARAYTRARQAELVRIRERVIDKVNSLIQNAGVKENVAYFVTDKVCADTLSEQTQDYRRVHDLDLVEVDTVDRIKTKAVLLTMALQQLKETA